MQILPRKYVYTKNSILKIGDTMVQIKQKGIPMEQTVSFKELFGKKVISKNGEKIGRVDNIYIHPFKLTVEAIKINKGFFGNDYYVGKEYISSLSRESVLLAVTPIKELIGKKVFDSAGHQVGKVKKVARKGTSNKLLSINVKKGIGKEVVILHDDIKEIGEGVVLRVQV